MFETRLRAALIAWLKTDPALAGMLNCITEEAPVPASVPWLGITASASSDWSVKDRRGREIRLALELHLRGDQPETGANLVDAIETRIESLPRSQSGFTVVTVQFQRARAEQRSNNQRAILVEYRFRLLEA
ncbi:MAG: DUF3168 domain-containing protein [Alteraurantiacibacter sp.]|nr:DUF3168 domain-containing protein [Alteraurantiacibacter sp.]